MPWKTAAGARAHNTVWSTSAFLSVCLVACGAPRPLTLPELDPAEGGDLVTFEEIEASGARTIWDVFRCCTRLRLKEDAVGNPSDLSQRGTNSLLLSDTPLIFIDGVRAADLGSLAHMSADDLLAVRVLSGAEAGSRYGDGADNGVIEIYTRR